MIVTVQNGMPWWYFHDFKGPLNGTRLKSLDPSGLLERHIPGGRIVGCVVYPAAAVTEPGVVTHVEGDRFPVGELDGSARERVQKLHDLLVEAGFPSRVDRQSVVLGKRVSVRVALRGRRILKNRNHASTNINSMITK